VGALYDVPGDQSRTTPDERILLAAARAGDQEAYGQLVTLHQRVAVRTALAALGRQSDAEDAAQDGFLLAWRRLGGFRAEASFRTWLLAIVWRQALAKRRAGRWFRLRGAPPEVGQPHSHIEGLASAAPDPEQTTMSRDLAARTARAIGRLSPKLKDTLLLAASGEHSYEEIGALLGIPVGTVKWRVSEARRQVAAAIDR
jgi:RNA polymerase sigma-70 factor (ECF subfamily)